MLSGSRQGHEMTAQRREKGNREWFSCRAPGALDEEKVVTVVVPYTLRRDLLSHLMSASITPELALVSGSRSRSAGRRYVKAWSRRD